MKYSTASDKPMTASYRSWEPLLSTSDNRTYRSYGAAEQIDCLIMVSPIGSVSLFAENRLQFFGIIHDMADAGGTPVMDEVWYSIQKVTPVFNSQGYITMYKHNIAILAPELVTRPITAPVSYPNLDQG